MVLLLGCHLAWNQTEQQSLAEEITVLCLQLGIRFIPMDTIWVHSFTPFFCIILSVCQRRIGEKDSVALGVGLTSIKTLVPLEGDYKKSLNEPNSKNSQRVQNLNQSCRQTKGKMELAGVMSLTGKGEARMEILNLFAPHHYKCAIQGQLTQDG